MADRKKPVLHLTPAGIARYPRLTSPDMKFKKEYGEYKITLLLPAEKAELLTDLIDNAMVESLAAAKAADPKNAKKIKPATDKPYKVHQDEDGNDTNLVAFNFKMAAGGLSTKTKEKWSRRPALFNAKGKPIDPTKINIGGGSTVKVAFELYLFYTPLVGAGVSLRLSAVQVINLVEYAGRDAKAFGFGEEEGYDGGEEGSVPGTTPVAAEGEEEENKAPADGEEF
jgi:hypothetical protein